VVTHIHMSLASAVITKTKQTLWAESASEIYRPTDRSSSAKLVQTVTNVGFHMVSVTDP
jgi:hypothetical protein